MRKLSIWFWGALALFGGVIQILGSIYGYKYYETPFNANETWGDYILLSSQAVGELCYLIALLHFLNVKKVLWCIMGFYVDLNVIDCVRILFFNPFAVALSQTVGYIFAFIILLIRLYSYDKRHSLY